jgi:hypothetical protein
MAKNIYTWDHIREIWKEPCKMGWLAGKDKLTPMHSKWIKYIFFGDEDRCLLGHRGSYKSTAMEIGAIMYLMKYPNARVAILRKNYTASAEVVRNIVNIMEMDAIRPLLELNWGERWRFTVKREGRFELSCKKTRTPQGSMTALGLDSGITGQHFDFILGDDVADIQDRQSEAEREHTKTIVREIRANVIDRGKHTSFIGTIWHPHDVFSILPPPLRFPISATGLISAEEAEKIKKTTTPVLYACNYDLEFRQSNDMPFQNPHMGTWHGDQLKNVKAHIDAAFKGDHYCALTIMGVNTTNNKLNAVGFVFAGSMKDWIPFVVQKLEKYGAKELLSEDNADKGYSADIIGLHPRMNQLGVWVSTYHESEKKDVKIIDYLGEVWKNIEWAEETEADYMEQVIDWMPNTEPNDAPDSCASLVREGNYSTTKMLHDWGVWSM